MERIDVGGSTTWEEWKDELTRRPPRLDHAIGETSRLERNDLAPHAVLNALEQMIKAANSQTDPENGRDIRDVNQYIAKHIAWCRRALASSDTKEVFAAVWQLANVIHDARLHLSHGGAIWRGQRNAAAASEGGASKASAAGEHGGKLAERDRWIVGTCLRFCRDRPGTRPTGEVLKRYLDHENNKRSPEERFHLPGARQIRNILKKSEMWKSARHGSR